MADFTASTGLRDIIAAHLEANYYWVTLHDATGGFVTTDVYAPGVRGELPSAGIGYTQGGNAATLVNTTGTLDCADSIFTAAGGDLEAQYSALWSNTTNTITGAVLISVEDALSLQTATDGNDMTVTITNPIVIPTPA